MSQANHKDGCSQGKEPQRKNKEIEEHGEWEKKCPCLEVGGGKQPEKDSNVKGGGGKQGKEKH